MPMTRTPRQDLTLLLLGLVMLCSGGFLLASQIMVSSGGFLAWGLPWGGSGGGMGLLLLPLLAGIVMLFNDSDSRLGLFLVLAPLAALVTGLFASLRLDLRPTNFWSLLTMLVLLGGGGGLIARSLRDYGPPER